MKLSENTLAILNNFKNLNNSILFVPGHEIKNLSSDKSVYMTATIQEEIPREFAVFNLRELLNVINVIQDAEIEFESDHLYITNNTNSVVFRYANPEVVDNVYAKKISLGDAEYEINLSLEQTKNLFKMAGYLDIHDVKIVPGDEGKLVLFNRRGSHAHQFTVNTNTPIVGEEITFNISVLSMLDMAYKLSYHPAKKLVRFAGQDLDVRYHVPCVDGY